MLADFWQAFCDANGVFGPIPETTVFGDSPHMQSELCELVLRGLKRATCSLAMWYGQQGDPLPKPGDLTIMLDGAGAPRGVLETVEVFERPFRDADGQFAADEGEGDGSLAYWTAEHRRYFTQELAKERLQFSDDMMVVFERFRLFWPGQARP